MDTPIVIVGGGFCGAVTTLQLLRLGARRPIVLIERGAEPGPGVAYSPPSPEMVLNVPPGRMGALQPEDFLRWLNDRPNPPLSVDGTFYSRAAYADYLRSVLREPFAEAEERGRLRIVRDEAVAVKAGTTSPIECVLASGARVAGAAVVLACGTLPKRASFRSERYFPDPWATPQWQERVRSGSALVIGTGLTGVDVVLELLRKSTATITLLSRHGQLPLAHTTGTLPTLSAKDSGLLDALRAPLSKALASLRARCFEADYRAVVDSLRSHTPEIWRSFSTTEQRRFIRHAASYWSIHRHRIPARVAEELAGAEAAGRLRVVAGSILKLAEQNGRIELRYRPRGTNEVQILDADYAIRCAGPAANPGSADSVLAAQLIRDHIVAVHPSGIGIEIESHYRARSPAGLPVYCLGFWLRGERWESAAVLELRVQAKELAEEIHRYV